MNIELEVGQVWIRTDDATPISKEIVKIVGDCVYYYVSYRTCVEGHDILSGGVGAFMENHTLITTADGKPYVPANDYQEGDVWEWNDAGYSCAILIIKHEGEIKLTSSSRPGRPYSVAESQLISKPQDYRLIYRDGKV